MKKSISLLKYELKNIKRNPLLIIMIMAPLLQIFMFTLVIPAFLKDMDPSERDMTYNILMLFGISLGSVYSGMILGFSLVETKDDKSINSIAVTPMGIKGYVIFKVLFVIITSIITTSIFLFSIKGFNVYNFGSITNMELFLIILIISLSSPVYGLLISTYAKDKVQAMAVAKSVVGTIMLLPLITLWKPFSGYMQYIFGIFPNFWATQALRVKLPYNQVNKYDLSFGNYLLIGIIISILVVSYLTKTFVKKSSN